jgi:transposase
MVLRGVSLLAATSIVAEIGDLTRFTAARRLITESAWAYRHPARKTPCIEQRTKRTTQEVQDIAWKAQTRLYFRYQMLEAHGRLKVLVVTAIARELTGFIWAIC